MRTFILLLVVAAALRGLAADQSAPGSLTLLPEVLTKEIIDGKSLAGPPYRLKFNGREYFISIMNLGDGVPYTQIGIYAPHEDGTFRRCLFAESWSAGSIKPTLDEKTGILELRETANSELKGQVVLACNLKTVGTQRSVVAR